MAVQPSFAPTADGKAVKFLGFNLAGEPKAFLLRVKTEEMANTLVDALKKETANIS